MKLAIMIYGYFYVDKNEKTNELARSQQSIDQLSNYFFVDDSLHHFMNNIYYPLRNSNIYTKIDVYMISHLTNSGICKYYKEKLVSACPQFNFHFTTKLKSPQITLTCYNLISHVQKYNTYDRHIILRNDLFYKQPITNWLPEFIQNRNFCWYIFNEINHLPQKRISDTIFVIDGNIDLFKKSIGKYSHENTSIANMHHIFQYIENNYGNNISPIINGEYDSNTAHNQIPCCNPIYVMLRRPYYFSDIEKVHNIYFK